MNKLACRRGFVRSSPAVAAAAFTAAPARAADWSRIPENAFAEVLPELGPELMFWQVVSGWEQALFGWALLAPLVLLWLLVRRWRRSRGVRLLPRWGWALAVIGLLPLPLSPLIYGFVVDEVRIALWPGPVVLEGVAVDAESQEPIAGAFVRFSFSSAVFGGGGFGHGSGAEWCLLGVTLETDTEGRFRVELPKRHFARDVVRFGWPLAVPLTPGYERYARNTSDNDYRLEFRRTPEEPYARFMSAPGRGGPCYYGEIGAYEAKNRSGERVSREILCGPEGEALVRDHYNVQQIVQSHLLRLNQEHPRQDPEADRQMFCALGEGNDP